LQSLVDEDDGVLMVVVVVVVVREDWWREMFGVRWREESGRGIEYKWAGAEADIDAAVKRGCLVQIDGFSVFGWGHGGASQKASDSERFL